MAEGFVFSRTKRFDESRVKFCHNIGFATVVLISFFSFEFIMKSLRICLVVLGFLAVAPRLASAAIIYNNLVESPTKIPGPTPAFLFGSPVVSGNNLDFNPAGFNASSSNGVTAFTDGLLSLTIMASSAQSSISSFVLNESGAYSVFGGTFSSPTPNTATSAFVSLNVINAQVVEIGGVPVMPINVPNLVSYTNLGNGVATLASGGIFFTGNGNPLTPSINQGWQASVAFNVAAVAPNATKVNLFFNNTLLGQSEASSLGFIDKKDVQILTTELQAIPEPSTILFGSLSGLLLIAASRRRRAA